MQPVEQNGCPSYSGIAQFIQHFEDPTNVVTIVETPKEKKERRMREKLKQHEDELLSLQKNFDPQKDPKATGDPYKTLFVGRINFNTSEHKFKREFEMYGPVQKVRVVQDKEGKPRGYGFIEYERERDMRSAYKQADGKKIDGRRVVVDVERGRTVRNWKPRRLGGGLGFTRLGPDTMNQKFSGREPPSSRGGERERSKSREREKEKPKKHDRDSHSRGEKRERDSRTDRQRY